MRYVLATAANQVHLVHRSEGWHDDHLGDIQSSPIPASPRSRARCAKIAGDGSCTKGCCWAAQRSNSGVFRGLRLLFRPSDQLTPACPLQEGFHTGPLLHACVISWHANARSSSRAAATLVLKVRMNAARPLNLFADRCGNPGAPKSWGSSGLILINNQA